MTPIQSGDLSSVSTVGYKGNKSLKEKMLKKNGSVMLVNGVLLISIMMSGPDTCRGFRPLIRCPEKCHCGTDPFNGLVGTHCRRMMLRNLPEDIPPYTTLLDLAHNHLEVLKNDTFKVRRGYEPGAVTF